MRNFTFKRQLLFVMFMLLGCLSIQAADDDLITRQIIIRLDEAGTLSGKIGSSKMYKITNLKIIGEINGTDLRMIREMAGSDYRGDATKGQLSVLDLSEVKVVKGGDYYCCYTKYGRYSFEYTSDDKIGDFAFKDCRSLTSLNLPSGITSIGEEAFYRCSGLTSITLPSGVISIGHSAFCDCSGLTSLTIPAGITSINYLTFSGCSGLTNLVLPPGVTSIGSSAFSSCYGLTSITLPSGVTSIGDGAFSSCSGLTSLTLPSGVTSIGKYAFDYCSGLTSIYVYAEKMPKLGANMFDGCDAKNCKVYVPKGTYDDYWLSEFGYFENIVEFDATGIDKVTTSTDANEVSRYSVNGQRLAAPTKGLNIVKYSDGSVKKVVAQ